MPKPPSPPTSVHVVASNISSSQLPANGSIQLAFDRLLLPSSITRQTFILQGNTLTPSIAYDPVSRVVTITPSDPLTPGQTYSLGIGSPQSATDPFGLRAIDGATLDPKSPSLFEFQVVAAGAPPKPAPTMDFCNDVFTPALQTCGGTGCHGSAFPAAGLLLTTTAGVGQTAIGRVARGANTGPHATVQPPGLVFGVDMPLIDPGSGAGGNPADSWLLYKMLMALPAAAPASSCDAGAATSPPSQGDAGDAGSTTDATALGDAAEATSTADGSPALADGGSAGDASEAADAGLDSAAPAATPPTPGAPANVCGVYSVGWQPLSSTERTALAGLVPGREMPYPTNPDSGPGLGVSVDELERISLWIAQGATVPAGGCGH